MKKTLSIFLAVIVLLTAIPLSVSAATGKTEDGFSYVAEGGYYKITEYTGGATEIEIPASIEGVPVKRIARYAFMYADPPIEKITIPEGVTTLDIFAFSRCEALKEISIPSTITEIPERAFHMTTSLESVIFPNGNNIVSIGEYAFYKSACGTAFLNDKIENIGDRAFQDCPIDELVIPENVTDIGQAAFSECGLKKLTLHSNIKTIGNSAFSYNELTEVIIPEGIPMIGNYAFCMNKMLVSVTIPSSVKTIGERAFGNCDRLSSVTLEDGIEIIGDVAFIGCKALESIYIPGSVTEIGKSAFYNCEALKDVVINYHISKAIDDTAFKNCHPDLVIRNAEYKTYEGFTYSVGNGYYKITGYNGDSLEVVIPAEIDGVPVKVIGNEAFTNISQDVNIIKISEGITTLETEAFANCTLKQVYIPSTVTEIPEFAFYQCTKLVKVNFPQGNNVISIGRFAFAHTKCGNSPIGEKLVTIEEGAFEDSLTSEVTIPEGVTEIPNRAFYGCGLTKVTFHDNILNIGFSAFAHNEIESIELPANLVTIDNFALQYNKIDKLVIPAKVKYIGGYAFSSNTRLTTATFGESLEYIGYRAFDGCTSLTTVELNSRLQTISTEAFAFCRALKEVVIPASVITVEQGAFSYCSSLIRAEFLNPNTNYDSTVFKNCSSDLKIISGNGPTDMPAPPEADWYVFDRETGVLTVNDGVTYIPAYAFEDYKVIKTVILPESITDIGNYAFWNCTMLSSINIPDNVSYIGAYAFCDTAITEISVPSSVTTLGAACFSGCSSLKTAVIEARIDYVPFALFYNCASLISVTIPDSVKTINENSFARCTALTEFDFTGITYISQGSFEESGLKRLDLSKNTGSLIIEEYAFAETALEYVSLPEGLCEISNCCFYGCSSLKEVVISKETETICQYAFYGCGITEIVLPEGITVIQTGAFAENTYLESIILPDTLTTIASGVFENCSSLKSIVIPKNVSSFGRTIFSGCDSLEYAEFAYGVKKVPQYCFSGCKALKEVKLSATVTVIESSAFKGCSALEKINLPTALANIDSSAFYECSSLKEVNSPAALSYLGSYAFYKTGIKSFTIAEAVSVINSYAFAYSAIEEIYMHDNVSLIDDSAFEGCTALKSIEISKGIERIDSKAFYNCTSLSFIDLPDYNGCYIVTGAFMNTEYYNNPDNWENGLLILDGYLLCADAETVSGTVRIPSSVHTICDCAFYSFENIEKIIVSEGVKRIGQLAFAGCTSMHTLVLPVSLAYLGGYIYEDCSALTITNYKGTEEEFFSIERDERNFEEVFVKTLVFGDLGYDSDIGEIEMNYDLSELFVNYEEKSLSEMVQFIAENQEVYYFVEYFRNRTENSSDTLYIHMAEKLTAGSGTVPKLESVGMKYNEWKYLSAVDVVLPVQIENSDIMMGEVGNKILRVRLNKGFIEYVNSLNRLDGNVMILDFIMNILANDNVAGIGWNIDGYSVGNTDIMTLSLLPEEIYEPSVSGDLNGDGFVNAIDSNLMKKTIVGHKPKIDPFAVDMNGDGNITAQDSLALKLKIVMG